jgi:putative glutamine amidotransferase
VHVPRIGITARLETANSPSGDYAPYIDAVRAAGGEPVILAEGTSTAQALAAQDLHGILFTGGGDIEPSLYAGSTSVEHRNVRPQRDRGEIELFRAAWEARVPMLCICRGIQVANVALRGTLIEDLPHELGSQYTIEHDQERSLHVKREQTTHDVELEPDSRIAQIAGKTRLAVNSMHHQAVRDVAAQFRVVARSDDGVIEALEAREPDERFFIAVQWHPEALVAHDRVSRELFRALVR